MARKTITIDPVTRIEGHLKVEALIDAGEVKDVKCSGVLFRGFELFLKGRDPRDAQRFTQRVCGVCPAAHATASTLALDNAFGIDGKVPDNGRILRNLIFGCNHIQSHILHFYHLAALDFVDITATADYDGNDTDLKLVKQFIGRDKLEPFVPRYEGDYRLTPEINRSATAHYIQALRARRKIHEILTIFGGKMPHSMGIVPGGVTATPSVDKISAFLHGLNELRSFIDNIYLPDVLAIAGVYKDYFGIGKGARQFMSYGVFDTETSTGDPVNRNRFLPQGIVDDSLKRTDVDLASITEDVKYSWYDEKGGNTHPTQEETIPDENKKDGYSWLKAPRYNGKPAEVGPLATLLSAYIAGHKKTKQLVDTAMAAAGVKAPDLLSVCGRHATRAIETKLIADEMAEWLLQIKPGEPAYIDYELPEEAEGVGVTDAPRGALGHWIKIKNGRIENYQLVVPTTWNASPKDAKDNPGPMEQALLGTKVKDSENPFEIVRIIRSFDPCLACSVHAVDHNGKTMAKHQVS